MNSMPHAGLTIAVAVPIFFGLIAVFGYKGFIHLLIYDFGNDAPLVIVSLFVIFLAFAFVRYPGVKGIRILLGGLGLVIGLNGFLLGQDLGLALDPSDSQGLMDGLTIGRILVLVAAVGSLLRPSMAAFAMLYMAFHKELSRFVSGAYQLGGNDYVPLVEVGLFLSAALTTLGLIHFAAARWTSGHPHSSDSEHLSAQEQTRFIVAVLFLTAIGGHLGNYFMSAIAKLLLDGGPLSWVFENPTSSLMLAGYELGTSPISYSPALFGIVYTAFSQIEIPMNLVTLSAQLFCFLAFTSRRGLIFITLFFDLMHVSIFLLTGALFLHWIILNSLIVAALGSETDRRFPTIAVIAGMIMTVAGHNIFYNARLGWYDSRELRRGYFVAETENGDEFPVSLNFFRDTSYTFTGRHFGYPISANSSGHLPTGAWGQIWNNSPRFSKMDFESAHEMMELARTCDAPVEGRVVGPDYSPDDPINFVKAQHDRAVRWSEEGRLINHNLYPHHHFSMPFRYREFESVDPRDIVAYTYVVETVCMGYDGDHVTRRVMARTESPQIHVR